MVLKTCDSGVTQGSSVDSLACEFDLEQFASEDDEGRTVAEMVAKSKRTVKWVRGTLQAAKVAQRLTVGRRRVVYIDGKRGFVPVYKIRGAKQ